MSFKLAFIFSGGELHLHCQYRVGGSGPAEAVSGYPAETSPTNLFHQKLREEFTLKDNSAASVSMPESSDVNFILTTPAGIKKFFGLIAPDSNQSTKDFDWYSLEKSVSAHEIVLRDKASAIDCWAMVQKKLSGSRISYEDFSRIKNIYEPTINPESKKQYDAVENGLWIDKVDCSVGSGSQSILKRLENVFVRWPLYQTVSFFKNVFSKTLGLHFLLNKRISDAPSGSLYALKTVGVLGEPNKPLIAVDKITYNKNQSKILIGINYAMRNLGKLVGAIAALPIILPGIVCIVIPRRIAKAFSSFLDEASFKRKTQKINPKELALLSVVDKRFNQNSQCSWNHLTIARCVDIPAFLSAIIDAANAGFVLETIRFSQYLKSRKEALEKEGVAVSKESRDAEVNVINVLEKFFGEIKHFSASREFKASDVFALGQALKTGLEQFKESESSERDQELKTAAENLVGRGDEATILEAFGLGRTSSSSQKGIAYFQTVVSNVFRSVRFDQPGYDTALRLSYPANGSNEGYPVDSPKPLAHSPQVGVRAPQRVEEGGAAFSRAPTGAFGEDTGREEFLNSPTQA